MSRSLEELAYYLHWVIYPHNHQFAHEVWSIMTSAMFAPPEMMAMHWGRLSEAFGAYIPQYDMEWEDWQRTAVFMLMGPQQWLDTRGMEHPKGEFFAHTPPRPGPTS